MNSVKLAAESLGMSSSTISEQITKLEKALEQRLFKRTAKGLLLTSVGEGLFEHAEVIFQEGNRILDKFSEDNIGGYSVSVGIEDTISNQLASEFASQYWDLFAPFGTTSTVRQPESEVLIENVVSDQLDWGISLREPKRRVLASAEIGSFEIVFWCSKELYQRFVDPADLIANIPLAETTSDQQINQFIRDHLSKNQVFPKEVISSDHPEFLVNLCERGRCLMFKPENPLEERDDMVSFRIGDPIKVKLYAIWKKKNENLVSITKLRQLIQSKLSNLPDRYSDIELQIEVAEVKEELLVEPGAKKLIKKKKNKKSSQRDNC